MKKLLLPAFLLCASSVWAQQKQDVVKVVKRNAADKLPTSIVLSEQSALKKTEANKWLQGYLGIDNKVNKAVLVSTSETRNRTIVEKYEQSFKDIKVEYGAYKVLFDGEGNARYVNANLYLAPENVNAKVGVKQDAARTIALQQVNATTYAWQVPALEARLKSKKQNLVATHFPMGELVWVEDFMSGVNDHKLHLAWKFEVYAVEPVSREYLYVDANTGGILHRNSLIAHTNGTGPSHYSGTVSFKTSILSGVNKLRDSTRGGGINTYSCANTTGSTINDVTSASTTWASDVALDAHWGAEKVYDYFMAKHGRNSYDNAGAPLDNYVHFGIGYNNAFWNGSEMVYGDGSGLPSGLLPLTSLDVCAHEIGHGICQYTAGLIYSGESGALNEGLSDIWAAIIEEYANPHEADARAKSMWEIGEEIGVNSFRQMDIPNMWNDPDTYTGLYWVNQVGCSPSTSNDYCGVHTNSGVLNHWFYRLCTGGTGVNDLGNTFSITGIGTAKGADIVYQTELLLTSTATFADFRSTSISAAIAMYGACSPEVQAVTSAWYAVGVGADYTGGVVGGITGAGGICAGTPVTLSSSTSGGTWSSSNTAVATVGTGGTVNGITAGTATISYAIGGGCFAVKTVTVSTSASAGTITGPTTICNGGNALYTSSVPGGSWGSSTPAVASITTAGIMTTSTLGSTTISYVVTNGCGTATATQNLTVNQAPAAIGGTTVVAVTYTTTLNCTPSGGTWSSSNTAVATVNSSGVVSGIANGTAIVTYALATGCNAIALITVGCSATSGTITTILGNGTAGMGPASGVGTSMPIKIPWGAAVDPAGNVYISEFDNQIIRKITPAGIATVFAGTPGLYDLGGDGSQATATSLAWPTGLSYANGNLYIDEIGWGRVRKVNSSGVISTVAGGGGSTANGVPATIADLGQPNGIYVDAAGNLFIPSQSYNKIRKVNTSGIINTIAGSGGYGSSGDGGPALSATFMLVNFVITDAAGNIFVSDYQANKIRRIDAVTNIITTYAGNGTAAYGGDNGPATNASIYGPAGLAFDADGNLLICDTENQRIRKVNKITGVITTIAGTGVAGFSGDGGAADAAKLYRPSHLAHFGGSIYFADLANNRARKITPTAISVSGTQTVCVAATTTLTATPTGGTWASSNAGIATVNTSGVVSGVAAGTANITYTVTIGSCGVQTALATVTVNASANAGTITGISTMCSGNSTSYTSSVPGGTWSSSNSAVALALPGGAIVGVAAGSAIISYAVSGACGTGYATKTLTVKSLPAAGFAINDDSQPLSGNNFVFTNTGASGSGYAYSWSFGDGSAVSTALNTAHTYTAAGIYNVVHTVSDIAAGCYGTNTQAVTVLSDSVGGGGGGGLESESLGGLVSKLEINDIKNSIVRRIDYKKAQRFVKTQVNGVAAKGTDAVSSLQRFMPAALPNTTAFINTPSQLTSITAAVDVLAVDYVADDRAKAVVLGITTRGGVYKHTKSICDRFRGGTLLATQEVAINGYKLIRFVLRMNDGNVEYCIAFDAGKSAGRDYFALQANWLIHNYVGDDSVFNFQVWAADPANTNKLAEDVLNNLAAYMPVQQIDAAFRQPPAYIATGRRNKGFLDVDITNNTTATSAELRFEEKPNELSDIGMLSVPVTLVNGHANKISIPIMDGYEYQGYLYIDGKLEDVVYMADGNWSLDFDPSFTNIQQYQTPNEPNRIYVDNEYAVYRGVTIKASSSDYISAFKFISGGNMPVDLRTYRTFKFNATGKGTVHVRLIKKSITKWKEQYVAKVDLGPGKKEYAISFDDFVTDKKGAAPIDASDVTSVAFTFDFGKKETEFNFNAGVLSFSPVETVSQFAYRSKVLAVAPNPSDGTFTLSFVSNAARLMDIVVCDITGHILYTQPVQAILGDNKVKVSLPPSIPLSVLILSLGNDGVKYDPVKINVTR